MGAARRKLHEQRGASMLMALLLLLVALTVSAVVIAAASSAAATLRSDKAREQSSLAVSSAAEYVRDAFLHGEMDGTVKADNNTTYTSSGSGAFLGFGMRYAQETLGACALRVTAAGVNARAIRACEKVGFILQRKLWHAQSGEAYYVMRRDGGMLDAGTAAADRRG